MNTDRLRALPALFGSFLLIAPVLSHAAKYKAAPVTHGGAIHGKLSFTGPVPADAIQSIKITKNIETCNTEGTGFRKIVWVDVKDGALRGAFVFIDKIAAGKPWPKPAGGHYMIEQKGCRFHPWAEVVRPGPIIVRNSDHGVLHNINTRELLGVEKGRKVRRTIFNFGQPDPGDIIKPLKPRRSPYIAVNCEAHNFMFGFMLAPKHPYATLDGADGSYSIRDIPPGTYTLKAWHPRFGVQKAKVTVAANSNSEVNFVFSQ